MGMMSNIIIEIYAMETALLRTEQMLHGKKRKSAAIPITITKVLFHDSIERISCLGTSAVEAMEDGALRENHLSMIRRLMVSPPLNTVSLRRDIANAMIQYGRYTL
jgi:hypothetical protein